MEGILEFLIRHSYAVLFVWVLLEQGGVPVPGTPLLLAAGALAAAGRMNLALILGTALAASLVSDVGWYGLGRRRGIAILNRLCRISLEPDSCVRKTENLFSRRGRTSLLVAKFIPGLKTVAAPLAGTIRMPFPQFVLFDALGAFLWIGIFVALGDVFAEHLKGLAALMATMGAWLAAILLGGLAAYVLSKFLARQYFLRRLRIARITPEELQQKLEAGEEVVIADLRHPLEVSADPVAIPGAVRWDAGALEDGALRLPRNREVILYCT
ncbi:MAG TPA: VTT domain-containing protein [Candidatus Sulfotelmatobacter sp.]|nr:VTT domain-containing protein [Candidatus Sulfotelmatobacter sp.]